MDILRRSIAALLLASAAAAPARAADPFVTVSPSSSDTSLAWWLLDMNSQPTGTIVAGVTLAQINVSLGAGEPRWCAAEVLSPASFTSPDAAVRAEIARYTGGPDGRMFSATTRMTGTPINAVVGNYRACEGGVAPFVLLVQQGAAGPAPAYVRGFFGWTPFIHVRADGNRLVVGSCLECDHAEVLTWNARTRRFGWQSEGH